MKMKTIEQKCGINIENEQIKEVTEGQIVEAQNIVRYVVTMQSKPVNFAVGRAVLRRILNLNGKHGLDDGLRAGLFVGLRAGLYDGLYAGLRDGLDDGLRDGLFVGLRDGLDDGLYAGLRDGLRDGLDDGLYAGLRDGLRDGLDDQKIQHDYVGVFWSWWLARYMIAAKWGVSLDRHKLALLHAYCMHAPIIGKIKTKEGKYVPIILPKPTKIQWVETGLTTGDIPLPIFELHSEGESTVEWCGKKLYYWHNVKIPERMGSVHRSEWRAEWLTDETNTEVRMILIREIGVEKVMHMGSEIDNYKNHEGDLNYGWFEKSQYKLVDMSNLFESDEPAPYLHMINQTTGAVHLEAVNERCKTIKDALSDRDGIDYNKFEVEIETIH
jgi:hypothetical protein